MNQLLRRAVEVNFQADLALDNDPDFSDGEVRTLQFLM
jgi:hypothetical protein